MTLPKGRLRDHYTLCCIFGRITPWQLDHLTCPGHWIPQTEESEREIISLLWGRLEKQEHPSLASSARENKCHWSFLEDSKWGKGLKILTYSNLTVRCSQPSWVLGQKQESFKNKIINISKMTFSHGNSVITGDLSTR